MKFVCACEIVFLQIWAQIIQLSENYVICYRDLGKVSRDEVSRLKRCGVRKLLAIIKCITQIASLAVQRYRHHRFWKLSKTLWTVHCSSIDCRQASWLTGTCYRRRPRPGGAASKSSATTAKNSYKVAVEGSCGSEASSSTSRADMVLHCASKLEQDCATTDKLVDGQANW